MISMICEMWEEGWAGRAWLLIVATLVLMIPLSIYCAVQGQREWNAFSVAHHCKVIAHMTGEVGVGVGTGVMATGKVGTVTMVTTTPDKTAYKCDDGVVYWR